MKKALLYFCLILVALALGIYFSLARTGPLATTDTVHIGGTTVDVALAVTPSEQAQGLSGVPFLGRTQGMLFVFPEPAIHGFWMKDMKISIDIIWLDQKGIIVDIKERASPSSYPEVFRPRGSALYVLEVPAGFAAEHRLKIGDKATLPAS